MRGRGWIAGLLLAIAWLGTGTARAEPPDGLPLVELPAQGQGDLLAIVWSGDGGWADLDKVIGESLAQKGVAVIGVDTLKYFWKEKPPERVAADVALIIRHYGDLWDRRKVVLIGYSFGADVLPFAYNRLPAPEKERVVQLSLLALSTFADFEFHLVNWVSDERHADSLDTAPELARLGSVPVQCFFGSDEAADSGCMQPQIRPDQRIEIKGGHHFDGDYEALAKRILAAAEAAG
ncbi:MAG: AcvB/VirJ family lysyl-phosphatidylglycerol hydrolase [Geminicoccaceae bacterium]